MKYIPKRYVTCIGLFVCLLSCYFFRSCMSIAILSMACDSSSGNKSKCNKSNPYEFDWSKKIQNVILASYFYGYFATNFAGSVLTHQIGPRWTMMIALCGASLFTFLTPVVTYITGYEYQLVIFCRIMVGLFCGPLYPSMHETLARWVPRTEITRLTVLTHSGNIVGLIVAYSSGALSGLSSQAWQYYLYFSGTIGVIAFAIWSCFVYDDPSTNPYISKEEEKMIIESLYPNGVPKKEPFSWVLMKPIFLSSAVWITAIAHMGNNFILYMFLTNFPKYLKDVYDKPAMKASLYTIIPFATNFIFQLVASFSTQQMQKRFKNLSITNARKIDGAIGFLFSCLFLVPAGFTENKNFSLAITLLSLGAGFIAFNQPGFFTAMIDLSPHYSAYTMGICNTIGSISGFVSPAMIDLLNKNDSAILAWKRAFIITGVVGLVCGCVWLAFGTSENQNWHTDHKLNIEKKDLNSPKHEPNIRLEPV